MAEKLAMKSLTSKSLAFFLVLPIYLVCLNFMGFNWFGAIVAIPMTLSATPLVYGAVLAVLGVLRAILNFIGRLLNY
jgi:hypothetical protein